MKNIDEIALRLKEIAHIIPGYMAGTMIDAANLLSELSKQEPVAYMFSKGPITKLDTWPHGGNWKPLFTHPLTTAEIEQRTAAAVLKFICHRGAIGPDGKLARDITKGKWREYL